MTTLKYVFSFGPGRSEGDPARVDLLGGKGASLAAMSLAGFPVPPGFTISTECCVLVEQAKGAWPNGLESQVAQALGQLEEAAGRMLGCGPHPLLVAVRSGAPVSMPGMMDTILNCGLHPGLVSCYPIAEDFWRAYADHIRMFAASVAGLSLTANGDDDPAAVVHQFLKQYESTTGGGFPTDPQDVLHQSINAVFASWNSDRARVYRQHHDVRHVVGTAVNVQMMFPSERSGVLFTANPNQPQAREMVLEASWGLGEAVVSGAVTPDIYILDADKLGTKRVMPGDRPGDASALSAAQVLELGQLGKKVETYFAAPSDIEWGLADGKLALLQARAIRGLDVVYDVEQGRCEEIERLRILAGRDHVVWVIHNLAETVPAPTPLTWDIVRHFMSGAGGYGRMYRELGYRTSEEVDRNGFLELICGRIYVDPRRAAGMFFGELPFEYEPQQILRDRQMLERAPTSLNIERADSLFFLRLPGLAWSMLRASRRMKRMGEAALERFEHIAVPRLNQFLADAGRQDLCTFDTRQLIAELDRRRFAVLDDFGAESLLPGFFAGLARSRLVEGLARLMGSDPAENLADMLTSGLPHDITVEQNAMLYRHAQGEGLLSDFLDKFGHRTANEMELSQPRWREDAAYLERMIGSFRHARHSPAERQACQEEIRRQAETDLTATLAFWGGSSFRERIERDLHQAQTLLPYREIGKYHLMRGYETIRQVLVELSRRWDLGRDLFFLQLAELPAFEERRDDLLTQIKQRKLRWKSAQQLVVGDIIDSQQLERIGLADERPLAEGDDFIAARIIASGAAVGTARVVHDPRETSDLGSDYILVCPSTDPGWTPLFVNARGLIVERGGVLSHGAIVARDFGIPAVVCEHATRRIPDGARIEIDGHRGAIVLLREASSP
jgi:phosphohistidine swiveling domain-containing protein